MDAACVCVGVFVWRWENGELRMECGGVKAAKCDPFEVDDSRRVSVLQLCVLLPLILLLSVSLLSCLMLQSGGFGRISKLIQGWLKVTGSNETANVMAQVLLLAHMSSS